MECKYVKSLKDKNSLIEFQKLYSYVFPRAYVIFVMKNNGGRPDKKSFVTAQNSERVLKSFLSFNSDDIENIWDMVGLVYKQSLIPFAIDNFGNLLCFDKNTDSIIFWREEDCVIELVSKSFNNLMEILY